MKSVRRFRRGLPAVLLLAGLLAPAVAKADPPLTIVYLSPTNNQITVSPANITVKFNQCVLAPPSSSVELRSPWGTLVSVSVSMPNCNSIVIGPTETLGSGEFTIFIYGITIGGSSTTMSTVFFVDNVAPAPPNPAITHPINDYNRTNVHVTGTGEPGSKVFVTIDDDNGSTPAIACGVSGAPACPTVGAGGAFNVGPFDVTSLDDSPRPGSGVLSTLSIKATVTLTDQAMNVSAPRYAYAFKDVVHPAAPVIDYPPNSATNANSRWTISGQVANETGYRYMDILLYDNGVASAGAKAFCITGSCAWHGTMLLSPAGTHQITAKAVDAAGNQSVASNMRNLTTSTDTATGPVRPSADLAPNPISTALSASGSAQASGTVTIKIAAGLPQPCGTGTSGSPPNYSCGPFDTSLLPGGIVLVQMKDTTPSNGGVSNMEIMKDLETPATPTVEFTDPDPWVNDAESSTVKLDGNAEPFTVVSGTVTSTGGGTPILFSTTADSFGNWKATTNTSTLFDGALTACVTSVDARGNASPSACTSSGPTLDRTPPPAPVIVFPAEASTVTTTTFNVGGTASGGATTVEIYEGANLRASGPATAFTGAGIAVTLYVDGPKTIKARSIDQAGNAGAFSLLRNFILDANPPQLASTSPPNNGVINPSGTVSATYTDPDDSNLGSCTLVVRDKGGALAMGSLSIASLTCSFAAAVNALSESGNPYTATVQVTDPSGNSSPLDSWTFNVDATPPPAPVWTFPAQNSTVGGPSVQVSGTAEPGAQVQIFNGLLFLGAAAANPNWSLNISFSDATYTLTAIAIDPAGNVGPGANRTFHVDLTPPSAPVISSPAPGSTVPDQTPVTGTAESGADVQLFEGVTFLGHVTANPSWSITPGFANGPHTVTAYAIDPVGNVSAASSRSYIVDVTAPAVPIITAPGEGANLNSTSVTVSGTAETGATVNIYDANNIFKGTTTATPSWSVPATFSEGTHTIVAKAVDLAGNNTTSAVRTFTVDTTAPNLPVIVTPGSGSTVTGSFTVQGTGERFATVELREGFTILGTTTVATNGLWNIPLSLPDGPHGIQAKQTDLAGNVSGLSPIRSFTVDATPPGQPVITDPLQNSINGAVVLIKGTAAEPFGTITITEGTTIWGTATVGGSGAWSKSITFADGNHSVTARQTDLAGNLGTLSLARDFVTDGSRPDATLTVGGNLIQSLSATTPIAVTVATPTLSGSYDDTGGIGAFSSDIDRVTVTITSLLTSSVVQSGNANLAPTATGRGTWTYVQSPLGPGIYRIDVTAIDKAGNVQTPPAQATLVTAGGA